MACVAVAVGTGLLLLPITREGPGSALRLTALFTRNDAVCVPVLDWNTHGGYCRWIGYP